MDKTIEIVVVAVVALAVAAIVLFLVQDRTSSFGGFLDTQQDSAECDLLKAQGEHAKWAAKCGASSYGSDSSDSNDVDCTEVETPEAYSECI